MKDSEIGIEPNLLDKFSMTDKGHYSHDGVIYYCEPYKYITKSNMFGISSEIVVKFDDNYKPISAYANGVQDDSMIETLPTIYLSDPRFIINNYKKQDIDEFGLNGIGYVDDDNLEIFGNIWKKVIKFISDTQFITYVFRGENGNWSEFEKQRWVFTIKN